MLVGPLAAALVEVWGCSTSTSGGVGVAGLALVGTRQWVAGVFIFRDIGFSSHMLFPIFNFQCCVVIPDTEYPAERIAIDCRELDLNSSYYHLLILNVPVLFNQLHTKMQTNLPAKQDSQIILKT